MLYGRQYNAVRAPLVGAPMSTGNMDIPNTLRFFVPASTLANDTVQLRDAHLAHQIARVLRLGPGDQVLMLDGQGTACIVELTSLGRDELAGRVLRRATAEGEPDVTLVLYLALLRAEKFEWVLQKGTELGVQRFVPVRFAHSLPADRADERKLERWRRIVREAAEQSCRGRLPSLAAPIEFAIACRGAATADQSLILWEREALHLREVLRPQEESARRSLAQKNVTHPEGGTAALSEHQVPREIAMLSGPEGGITAEELTTAREHGIIPISLGPRILRAETAPIAAISMIMYEIDR